MAIGRVSGSMLVSDLDRQGTDLQFTTSNKPLVYMDFSQFRLGVNTNAISETVTISGNLSTSNVLINGLNISAKNSETLQFLGEVNLGDVGNVGINGGATGYVLTTDGSGNLSWTNPASGLVGLLGNTIQLGANTSGALVSNAVSLTTTTSVTNGIALLNQIVGRLVPPAPPTFPGSNTLSINSITTYGRMCNFTQTDNTATGSKNVAGGTSVSNALRVSSYTTSTVNDVGPGDDGTVTVYKNGVSAGSTSLTVGSDNGSYSDLRIADNVDYGTKTGDAQGFWESFDAYATGTVSAGWNEVYIIHSSGSSTNTPSWYYDSSSPGTPTFSATSIVLSSNVVSYSSTIPHFTTSAGFTIQFDVNKLSGDMYYSSDTFVVGTAGGAFGAPTSKTYAQVGVTTPLSRNLYVSSGAATVTTTANITSGFGSSSSGPSVAVYNSYATGTQTFAPGYTILYKTGTSNQIEETSLSIAASVGTGSGNPYRIVSPAAGDTPAYSGSESSFNSQTGTLNSYDATVVGAVLKHDQTNYSSGYLPVGPDLSSGRSGNQYFTFKFSRSAVSKFDIKYTGTIAGLWVALPGSTIDTSSTLNGWIDMGTAYAGSGVPGAGTGGNGSDGCALGGVAVFNSAQTNKSVTCTFGTVSSSSTLTNEIYIRVKLTSGQTVTALSIEAATH